MTTALQTDPECDGVAAVGALLDRRVRRLPAWRRHGEKYVTMDPFDGERDTDIRCRTVTLRQARQNYLCWGLAGQQDHGIQAGDYYRHERGVAGNGRWGQYRMCLGCMDAFIEGRY